MNDRRNFCVGGTEGAGEIQRGARPIDGPLDSHVRSQFERRCDIVDIAGQDDDTDTILGSAPR